MGQTTMFLFPTRCLFNAMTNAMINAIFTGGVNHGVICIHRFHCYGIFISDYLFCKLLFSET